MLTQTMAEHNRHSVNFFLCQVRERKKKKSPLKIKATIDFCFLEIFVDHQEGKIQKKKRCVLITRQLTHYQIVCGYHETSTSMGLR